MPNSGNPFFKLGQAAACVSREVPMSRVAFARSLTGALDAEETGSFHKAAALCAAAIYEAAGRVTDFGFSLYTKIASSEWEPAYAPFMDAFYEAAGTVKQANPAANIMLAVSQGVDAAARIAPDLGLAAVGGSMLLGSSLGALHWKMNRDVDQDDPQSEVMKARAGEYARLANEIEHNLKLKQHARGQSQTPAFRAGVAPAGAP